MIGITKIGTFIPEGRVDTLSRQAEFGVTEAFLRGKTGFTTLARKHAEMDTSDMAVEAVHALKDLDLSAIQCLVVCTQTPDGAGLPHTSGIVHRKLGLGPGVAAFDISLGCSGYVYGLSVISSFMAANGMKNGLFVTADPYSKILDEGDKNTALLFGDAATATLMTDTPLWRVGPFAFGSDGRGAAAIAVGEDGRLAMNGRAVFTFSASTVPPFLNAFLHREALTLDALDHILMHQGSRFIVDTIRKELGASEDQLRFEAAEVGNTVSSTLPLMLAGITPQPGARVLLCGFGVGLSWAAGLLTAA